mgnify:CR=1 FL=1
MAGDRDVADRSRRPDEDPIERSLNLSVPGRVAALASDLRPALAPFDRVRERHTLVVKRLGEVEPVGLEKRVRRALSGAPAFEVQLLHQVGQPRARAGRLPRGG